MNDSSGLKLVYQDQFADQVLSKSEVIVQFDAEAVLAFRQARTTDFYNDIIKIEDIDNGWVFTAESSSFMDWLINSTHYEIKCMHYKFITDEEIIDVLSYRPPQISERRFN